ncbi:hypothetical protein EDD16DRAFT_590791 [Pisolithus croceorrhizus]|nr:hypothetical protein EDD16DRAFT_590791 [Pisolithus croceorrhizus]
MTALTLGETTSPISQIVSAVLKLVTGYFLLVLDWVQARVPSLLFYVVVAIASVSTVALIPRIALWVLKTVLQLVWCSIQWLGQAFVCSLGFGSKGVKKDHPYRFHILVIPVCGCKAALGRFLTGTDVSSSFVDVDISQTSMNCAYRCSRDSM